LSPLRILILIGLFYLLFKLLANSGRTARKVADTRSGSDLPAQDVLREDPICRTMIPARQAITWTTKGKIIYFCSEDCRRQFITSQGDRP